MEHGNIPNAIEQKPEVSVPESFPIRVDSGHYMANDVPELREGEIVQFERSYVRSNDKMLRFMLVYPIGDLHYIFDLTERYDGGYAFNFKTKEYRYARTELGKDDADALAKVSRAFLESVEPHFREGSKDIFIHPSPASYSTKDIEECIEKILASPKNTLTEEELKEAAVVNIFEIYKSVFGENFFGSNDNAKNSAKARARFFQAMAKKYLPDWELKKSGFRLSNDLVLSKNAKKEETL